MPTADDLSSVNNKIDNRIVGPYNQYCVGYPGKGPYLVALVIGVETFDQTFTHPGSKILDSVVAFDRAETKNAYIGQTNIITVSSFCGPHGLIWGYDLVRKEGFGLPPFISSRKIEEFKSIGIQIESARSLREAAIALFGENDKRHFPFLPGTHVPCANKYLVRTGPAYLYGAVAIGIAEDRKRNACSFMEDVGEITNQNGGVESSLEKRAIEVINSVIEIGRNQRVKYKKIFVDIISKQIKSNEVGCILLAIPYFLLAKKAFDDNLMSQSLEQWVEESRNDFLCHQ